MEPAPAEITFKEKRAFVSKWFMIAVFNLFFAASIGVLLRYAFVNEVKWLNYKLFQNAHSHLAILGWAYQALFAFLCGVFLNTDKKLFDKFNRLFWFNQAIVICIVFNFLFLGNPLLANILVAVFSIAAFLFIFFLYGTERSARYNGTAFMFLYPALLFLGLSFIGTYISIPSLIVSGNKKILLYYIGSQTFLHFQYNGWFTFAVLALFFRMLDLSGASLDKQEVRKFRNLMFVSVFLTYFLTLFWANQNQLALLFIAAFGGVLQLYALLKALPWIRQSFHQLGPGIDIRFNRLIIISFICLLIKFTLQLLVAFPFIATLAFTIRNYVISYLHLVFIGFLGMFVFGWAIQHHLLTISRTVRLGVFSLVTGFILVELVLFVQGTLLWTGNGFIQGYYPFIFLASVLIPLGLIMIICKNIKSFHLKKTEI